MTVALDESWDHRFEVSPFRLRFELGGEFGNIAEPVPRFMQALIRSRTIRQASFAGSEAVLAIVHSRGTEGFEVLREMGFRRSPVADWQVPEKLPDGSVEDQIWRAFDVTGDEPACDTLLWSSIVKEMPIKPKAPVGCYLIDMERDILFHVYDDRGLDLTALVASSLIEVREQFDSWISPNDRTRIEAAFAQ